mmetsp:Transcript_12240/g.38774  ORF Transcript_12240/g.38774 Transcript_12240/m.38774 type:complete len:214 (+) Transcript_12240:149-790(+)
MGSVQHVVKSPLESSCSRRCPVAPACSPDTPFDVDPSLPTCQPSPSSTPPCPPGAPSGGPPRPRSGPVRPASPPSPRGRTWERGGSVSRCCGWWLSARTGGCTTTRPGRSTTAWTGTPRPRARLSPRGAPRGRRWRGAARPTSERIMARSARICTRRTGTGPSGTVAATASGSPWEPSSSSPPSLACSSPTSPTACSGAKMRLMWGWCCLAGV